MATEIGKIDKNLDVPKTLTEKNIVWHSVPGEGFRLYGLLPPDGARPFLRMPEDAAAKVSPGVMELNRHTAGGRVSFETDSSYIALRAATPKPSVMPHMTLVNQAGFDLYVRQEDGSDAFSGSFIPPCGMEKGFESIIRAFGEKRSRQITINFPLYNGVNALWLGVEPGAVVKPFAACREGLPVVFYGSSITQGGCSTRPGLCYTAVLSRKLRADHINLGFSGSARGETAMADYLAALPMRAFVMDYDQNAPDLEHLKKTHLPMLRAVRAGHPDMPIFVVSFPTALRPVIALYGARRQLILDNCRELIEAGDHNVTFIDGFTLMSGEEADGCTVDGAHPNDLGFFRMAQGMLPYLRRIY